MKSLNKGKIKAWIKILLKKKIYSDHILKLLNSERKKWNNNSRTREQKKNQSEWNTSTGF